MWQQLQDVRGWRAESLQPKVDFSTNKALLISATQTETSLPKTKLQPERLQLLNVWRHGSVQKFPPCSSFTLKNQNRSFSAPTQLPWTFRKFSLNELCLHFCCPFSSRWLKGLTHCKYGAAYGLDSYLATHFFKGTLLTARCSHAPRWTLVPRCVLFCSQRARNDRRTRWTDRLDNRWIRLMDRLYGRMDELDRQTGRTDEWRVFPTPSSLHDEEQLPDEFDVRLLV